MSRIKKCDKIEFVSFTCLSENQIRRLSEKEIILPSSRGGGFSETSGTPYDENLGVLENGKKCLTCQKANNKCPGHYGHIELPAPMYNKTKSMLTTVCKVLQCICQSCSRPRIIPAVMEIKGVLSYKRNSRLKAVLKQCERVKLCPWEDCGKALIFYDIYLGEIRSHLGDKNVAIPFSADKTLKIFSGISDEHFSLLGFNHNLPSNPKFFKEIDGRSHILQVRPEDFIITVLPVIPPIARPYVKKDGSEFFDDDLTEIYNSIIKLIRRYNDDGISTTKKPKTKLTEDKKKDILKDIQNNIQKLSEKGSDQSGQSSNRRPLKSISDRLEGKTGLVQSCIGGKRSNFSGRGVITGGGIHLRADEFGIPQDVAEELTLPEKVTGNSIEYITDLLRSRKINRVLRKGGIIRIKGSDEMIDTFELQIGDIAERQLVDGDCLLINRQPTLRKESAYAVKIKIHKDPNNLSFVLPVCFTTPTGADFDGDEMNIHLPQSPAAQAEIKVLCGGENIIVTPQRNSPIVGICQDGLVSLYLMTLDKVQDREATMVEKETFMQVITLSDISMDRYNDLLSRAHQFYPSYVTKTQNKNNGLCSYSLSDNVPGKLLASILFPANFCYTKRTHASESKPDVIIKKGILLPESGPLCKKSIGVSSNSVVHNLWKEYSPTAACDFLTDAQFLGDHWLQFYGFSVGIEDCFTKSNDKIKEMLSEVKIKCHSLSQNNASEEEICAVLNSAMNLGPKITKECIVKGELNPFSIMKNCGAKGSDINGLQISAFLGQQNVKTGRIPNTLDNNTRTLPHFRHGEDSIESRGFIQENFLNGLDPSGFFMHAESGREGVISTSTKTSETGYAQRRIGEKLKNFTIRLDGAVEDVSGQIIQFLYHGDGMDPQKIYRVPGLNHPFFANPSNIAETLNVDAELADQIIEGESPRNLDDDEIDLLLTFINCGDPRVETPVTVQATKNIHSMLIPKLQEIQIYEIKIGDFFREMRNTFESSKIQYGEAVGLITAVSICEISTQLTLDAFHLAGVKGNDVTLGIPKFNELIDVSKKPKTPSCTVFFTDQSIKENAKIIKSGNISEDEVQNFKNKSLMTIRPIINKIEETVLISLLEDHEYLYVENEIDIKKRVSPVWILVECEKYKEEWWSKLYRKFNTDFEPQDWVVMLNFNIEKLYQKDLNLEIIAKHIENENQHKIKCVPSPLCIGKIELHADFDKISEYLGTTLELPSKEKSKKKHLTPENLNYFICRDVIMGKIINNSANVISGSGIKGMKSPFPREDITTGEYVVDFRGSNFLDVLTVEGVDMKRTTSNHIWAVYDTLGIEATLSLIMNEMTNVISSGNNIDLGYIELLVRGITKDGIPTIVRRDGINREDVGPWSKILFEMTIRNLGIASTFGETDPYEPDRSNKKSVAMSVAIGSVTPEIGTGTVKIVNSDRKSIAPIKVPKSTKKIQIIPHK